MASQVSLNLRFLLWKRKVPRTEWANALTQLTALSSEVIRGLVSGELEDAKITEGELQELARALDLDDIEGLRFSDLVHERTDVLLENLRYLLGSLEHGGKKALAKALGI